jgi:hypothetical protein
MHTVTSPSDSEINYICFWFYFGRAPVGQVFRLYPSSLKAFLVAIIIIDGDFRDIASPLRAVLQSFPAPLLNPFQQKINC